MKSFLKSFLYAFRGINSAIKTQRNFRIHIIAMIYVIAFSLFYDLTNSEYMILVLVFALVISLELINTALEKTVDICSPNYSKLAEISKDCAAGAVFISAVGAIVIGIIMFADAEVFKRILNYYRDNLIALSGLIFFTVIAILFIGFPFDNLKGNENGYEKGIYNYRWLCKCCKIIITQCTGWREHCNGEQ